MNNMLVVGSLAFDSIKTPAGFKKKCLGGSANYFSLVASRYASVKTIGVVGSDYEDAHIEILATRGVDVSGIERQDGLTFHWEGRYKEDLNEAQTLATHLNVFEKFNPQLSAAHKSCDVLFLANIDPKLQLSVLEQANNPKVVAVDTMNFWIETKYDDLKKVLKKANILFVNQTEALMITRESNAVGAASVLSQFGPQVVVIKRGEYGALLYSKGEYFALPAFPVKNIVDPTGAGDSFAAGFMGHIIKRGLDLNPQDLRRACLEGAMIASFTVEDFGLNRLINLTEGEVSVRFEQYMNTIRIE